MCADDVVCTGAEPLAFLDYVAVGRLDPVDVAELVGGRRGRLPRGGCALVGGETAEHPGVLEADEFDLAGCCIGVVERVAGHRWQRGRRRRRDPGPGLVRAPRQRLLARPRADRAVGPRSRRAVPGPAAPDARRRGHGRGAGGGAARDAGHARRGAPDPDPDLRPSRARGARGASWRPATTCTASPTSPAAGCPGTCRAPCPTDLGARLDPIAGGCRR